MENKRLAKFQVDNIVHFSSLVALLHKLQLKIDDVIL